MPEADRGRGYTERRRCGWGTGGGRGARNMDDINLDAVIVTTTTDLEPEYPCVFFLLFFVEPGCVRKRMTDGSQCPLKKDENEQKKRLLYGYRGERSYARTHTQHGNAQHALLLSYYYCSRFHFRQIASNRHQ